MVLNTPLQKFDGTAIPKPLRELRRWAPWAAEWNAKRNKYDKLPKNARRPEFPKDTRIYEAARSIRCGKRQHQIVGFACGRREIVGEATKIGEPRTVRTAPHGIARKARCLHAQGRGHLRHGAANVPSAHDGNPKPAKPPGESIKRWDAITGGKWKKLRVGGDARDGRLGHPA